MARGPRLVLERGDEPVDDRLVPVVAAQDGVATGGLNFKHAVADFEDRNVECAAAEVEDKNCLVAFAATFKAVGQGRCGWFVDNAEHLEAGDLAGFFGRGALGIVEVCRHRNNGLVDFFTQVSLSVALQLLKRSG